MLGFTDTGLTPGQTYTYRVFVTDGDGNQAAQPDDLGDHRRDRRAQHLLRPRDGRRGTHPLASRRPGRLHHDQRPADRRRSRERSVLGRHLRRARSDPQRPRHRDHRSPTRTRRRSGRPTQQNTSDNMSVEVWVKTSSTTGGRIIGFSNGHAGRVGHLRPHAVHDQQRQRDLRGEPDQRRVRAPGLGVDQADRAESDRPQQQPVAPRRRPPSATRARASTSTASGSRPVATWCSGQAYQGYWRVGYDNLAQLAVPPDQRLPPRLDRRGRRCTRSQLSGDAGRGPLRGQRAHPGPPGDAGRRLRRS